MIMLFWPLISKVLGKVMLRLRGGGLKPAE